MVWPARYAHAPGPSAVALCRGRSLLLTIGPDLLLNGFALGDASPDEFMSSPSPSEHRPQANGTATCIVCPPLKPDTIVTGGTGGEVLVHRLPDVQFERTAMVFALPVRAVASSSNGRIVAAAGDECVVKVLDGQVDTLHCLQGHSHKVLGLAVSDRAPLISSLAANGEVRLWSVGSGDGSHECVAKHGGLAKHTHQWSVGISYNADGSMLAVPNGTEIVLFDAQLKIVNRVSTKHSDNIIGCHFSESYLVSYGADGCVGVYDDCQGTISSLLMKAADCAVLSITVHNTTVYLVDEEGNARVGRFDKKDFEIESRPKTATTAAKRLVESSDSDAQQSTGASEAEDDTHDAEMAEEVRPTDAVSGGSVGKHPVVNSNNTPFDANCRYLMWNAVGKIIARRDAASQSTVIDVHFADSRTHRPLRFSDEYGIEFGDVDERGCVFGSHQTVIYMPTGGWSVRANTVLQLQAGSGAAADEQILSVSCSESFIFVLTSHFLRIVGCSGIQVAIMAVPHNCISVTASSTLGCLVLYQEFGAIKGLLVDAKLQVHPTGQLNCKSIRWVGRSLCDELNMFGAFDGESGDLYVLRPPESPKLALQWLLVHHHCNQSDSEAIWPVFFTSTALHAIHLHDHAKYPETLPVPLISEIPFSAPLLGNPFEPSHARPSSTLYTNSVLVQTTSPSDLRVAADKNTLELFQIALKMDHYQRALDLCSFFFLARSRDLALQLAQHARATVLVEQLLAKPAEPRPDDEPEEARETQANPLRPLQDKRIRIHVPSEEFTFTANLSQQSQQQSQSTQTEQLPPSASQERTNPFSKQRKENYVNIMERLSSK